ncbi:MAG: ABC-F family ATP-binding cassette domain-containing protein [Ruminococcus sp.]|nr:ABC-F family ATP-binding cassette domain-containing protein [Ruminococcus sp.]
MLVNIEHLWKYIAGEPLLRDISLTVEDREAVGLIGRNGCGKSTLLNIITGRVGFDKTPEGLGSVAVSSRARVGFLEQNSGLESSSTIEAEMLHAFDHLLDTKKRMEQLEAQMTSLPADQLELVSGEYSQLSSYFEAHDGYRIDVKIRTVLNGMGFGNVPTDRLISSLSGGEKTRLALARLLLEEPDLLILDEPTNHLDLRTLTWLEGYLKAYKGSVLIVSHDRYFLDKVCTRICEIEDGVLTSYKGGYTAYLSQKKMNVERQIKEYEAQQREIEKLEDYIVRNKTRASTAKMAKSRQHMLDRIERTDRPITYDKPPKIRLEYDIEPTKDIVKVQSCPVAVGEGAKRKMLIPSLDLHIRRGEHAAIIGPNGIGKTSVLKLIQGLIPREGGSISWGGNVKISYFDQEHSMLDPRDTVIGSVDRKFPRISEQQARNMLGSVLISGEDVFKPVSVLSGGERAKLCFAHMALNRGNVLILDEPTNHIDLGTKEVLEEALADFTGTMILVSHDRYLINKVASRVIELSPEGARSFEGSYDDYAAVIAAEEAEAERLRSEQKQAERLAEYNENKQKQYRSKAQRAEDAKRRARIRELEDAIAALEEHISELEAEISDPAVASDFPLMTEKCAALDEARSRLDTLMEEWAELGD